MANLGDIGLSTSCGTNLAPAPVWRLWRSGGLDVQIPALTDGVVSVHALGAEVDKVRSESNIAHAWNLAPGNYVATTIYGPGTGTAWSVIVTTTSYTVTLISGSGDTGFIVWG